MPLSPRFASEKQRHIVLGAIMTVLLIVSFSSATALTRARWQLFPGGYEYYIDQVDVRLGDLHMTLPRQWADEIQSIAHPDGMLSWQYSDDAGNHLLVIRQTLPTPTPPVEVATSAARALLDRTGQATGAAEALMQAPLTRTGLIGYRSVFVTVLEGELDFHSIAVVTRDEQQYWTISLREPLTDMVYDQMNSYTTPLFDTLCDSLALDGPINTAPSQ